MPTEGSRCGNSTSFIALATDGSCLAPNSPGGEENERGDLAPPFGDRFVESAETASYAFLSKIAMLKHIYRTICHSSLILLFTDKKGGAFSIKLLDIGMVTKVSLPSILFLSPSPLSSFSALLSPPSICLSPLLLLFASPLSSLFLDLHFS